MDGYLASMSRKDQSRWFGLIGFFDFLFKQFELQKQQQQQHLQHNFEEKSRKQKITKHSAPVCAFIEPCSDFMSLISGTCMVIIVIVMVSLLINHWLLFIIITMIRYINRKLHCPALLCTILLELPNHLEHNTWNSNIEWKWVLRTNSTYCNSSSCSWWRPSWREGRRVRRRRGRRWCRRWPRWWRWRRRPPSWLTF